MYKGPVLYVEDDQDDIEILQDFLRKADPDLDLGSFDNGHALIHHLQQLDEPLLPCLLILDKNAPRISGLETMQYLKSHPRFREIPIVLFSSGLTPSEKKLCAEKGVATVSKPDSVPEWEAFCRHIIRHCHNQLSR